MKLERVIELAGKWGYDEELGQIWLEREMILKKVNRVPPPCRERRLRSVLRTIQARMHRKDRPPQERTAGLADFSPDKIRRKW